MNITYTFDCFYFTGTGKRGKRQKNDACKLSKKTLGPSFKNSNKKELVFKSGWSTLKEIRQFAGQLMKELAGQGMFPPANK